MSQPLPDEIFLSAVSDVVWRFYAYEQYDRDVQKAIEALKKRVPGYAPEFYGEQVVLHLKILLETITAVTQALKRLTPETKNSQYSDVDQELVMNRLRAAFPDQSDELLSGYIDMIIYWYYLK